MTTWMPAYHRDLMPDGVDHSEFGSSVRQIALVDSMAPFARARDIRIRRAFHFPESTVYGDLPDEIRHFTSCQATMHSAVAEPSPIIMFLPDHAALVEDGNELVLLSESFWHSELFFSKWFRNDRSTGWSWRTDNGWTLNSNLTDTIGIAYHRYCYQYFHLFVDSLPRIYSIMSMRGSDVRRWYVGPLDQPFQLPSLQLFGLKLSDCILPDPSAVVRFEQGITAGFRFEEPLKTIRPDFRSGISYAGWSPDFCSDIRDRGRKTFAPSSNRDFEKIYVARGDATHRRIANEADVMAVVEEFGFAVVTPGRLSFEAQVSTFGATRWILGIHGAGLTNLLWAAPGAQVMEFMPSGLFDVGYRFLAPQAGHYHSVIICNTLPHEHGLPFADIEVDIVALRRALHAAK